MTVTLTITAYNNWRELVRTLETVMWQRQMPDEVIVADDGSSPSLGEQMAAWCGSTGLPVIHVWHPKKGFRKCELLNKAAIQSHSEFVLYVDHDCLVPRSFVKAHVRFARADLIHLGPRIHVLPPSSERFRPSAGAIASAILRRKLVAWREAIRPGRVQKTPLETIEGCNMMIPSAALRSLNGFDNRYRAWGYGEDADIVLRGWQAGYRMGLSGTSTTVFHLWHQSNQTEVNRPLFDETASRNQPRCNDGLDAHFGARTTREQRGCYTRVAYDY